MRSTSKRVIYIEQPLYRYIISRGERYILEKLPRVSNCNIRASKRNAIEESQPAQRDQSNQASLSSRERETRKETPRRLILSIIRSRASFYNFSIRFEAINQPTPTPLRGEESSVSHESSLQTRIVVGFPVHARNKARFLAIRTAPLSRISLEK